jgi:hypothetical protein
LSERTCEVFESSMQRGDLVFTMDRRGTFDLYIFLGGFPEVERDDISACGFPTPDETSGGERAFLLEASFCFYYCPTFLLLFPNLVLD